MTETEFAHTIRDMIAGDPELIDANPDSVTYIFRREGASGAGFGFLYKEGEEPRYWCPKNWAPANLGNLYFMSLGKHSRAALVVRYVPATGESQLETVLDLDALPWCESFWDLSRVAELAR